jgi:hypothetical protein
MCGIRFLYKAILEAAGSEWWPPLYKSTLYNLFPVRECERLGPELDEIGIICDQKGYGFLKERPGPICKALLFIWRTPFNEPHLCEFVYEWDVNEAEGGINGSLLFGASALSFLTFLRKAHEIKEESEVLYLSSAEAFQAELYGMTENVEVLSLRIGVFFAQPAMGHTNHSDALQLATQLLRSPKGIIW